MAYQMAATAVPLNGLGGYSPAKVQTLNFVHGLATRSTNFQLTNCINADPGRLLVG